MELRKYCIRWIVLVAYISISATTTFFARTDARHVVQFSTFRESKVSKTSINKPLLKRKSSIHKKLYVSETESSGLSTSFSMPPIESISPLSSPPNIPAPICIYPPFPPNSPAPSPPYSITSPPEISPGPNQPSYGPSPPSSYGIPIPPHKSPVPSPPKVVPTPPAVRPPSLARPPPPHKPPKYAVWCVAKPTVPDSIMQEAMDYACGSGADCKSIQINGPCFQPNTLFAHASYAFNSYWQKTKLRGGTCDFGGTAMLITVDPSFGDCHFIYN